MPDTYTHGHHESVLRSHTWRTAENSAGYLLPHLTAGMRLLDVGCGPGTITLDLAQRVAPGGRVVGLEPVAAPLEVARGNAADRGDEVSLTVEWVVGDVYALDAPDATYDVVHAHQVLQHLTDPVAALREMRRVTRPGGLLAVRDADYAAMVWHPRDPRLDRWLEVYEAVARGNDAEPDAARHLLAWAHAAGLQDVTCTASTWCYAGEAERTWWGGLWADRIRRSGVAEQAIARGIATTGELEEIAGGWRAWAADPDGWFAVVNGELIARV